MNLDYLKKENPSIESEELGEEKINDPASDAEFELNGKIWEGVEEFENNSKSKKLREIWQERFSENPENILRKEHLDFLKDFTIGERLRLLAWASSILTTTPHAAKDYFATFPNDLRAVERIFEECRGFPDKVSTSKLFTIAAPYLEISRQYQEEPKNPKFEPWQNGFTIKSYLDKAERRDQAPEHIMNGTSVNPLKEKPIIKFGKAGDDVIKILKIAFSQLTWQTDIYLRPENAFGEAYEKLSQKEKASLLIEALREIQLAFVHDEVFNGTSNQERIEEDNRRWKTNENKYVRHNVAHSILFHTFQPSMAYDSNQAEFDSDMTSSMEQTNGMDEYGLWRLTNTVIEKMSLLSGDEIEEITDSLVDFWNKNRNPFFANSLAKALSAQNPERAAARLMQLIRSDRTPNKNALAAILYRLEFGRIGISQDGVEYLQRRYDLGEFNNPEYFVNRLTAQGDIGIFNENAALVRHFNLGDLASNERSIRAAVLEFTYETLFTPRANETQKERTRRERVLEEFKQHYFNFAKSPLFKDVDVQLNNLSFKEQGWLLHFYEGADEPTRVRLVKLIKTNGENGLRACLALEHGEEFRETILAISENLPTEAAELFFMKYGQIMDAALEAGKEATSLLGGQRSTSYEEQQKIYQRLSERARTLLLQVSKQSELTPVQTHAVMHQLEQVKADILLFAATFRVASESKSGISLEDIAGTSIETISPEDLSEIDKQTMLSLYKQVREDFEDEHRALRTKGFEDLLKSKEGRFYILRHQEEIIGFIHFKDLENGNVYGGSFSVLADVRGEKLGNALLQAALDKENQTKTVEAVVDANNAKLVKYYTEVLHHKLTGETVMVGSTKYLKMTRPASQAIPMKKQPRGAAA